jgi:hypothetical protein
VWQLRLSTTVLLSSAFAAERPSREISGKIARASFHADEHATSAVKQHRVTGFVHEVVLE